MNRRQVIVVGAGISGLSCALRLRELGVEVEVLEAAENAGGVISTVRREGFLFESGPQSFQLTPDLRSLIQAAGCESDLIEADSRAPRYILRRGKLHPAPMSPPSLLTTSLLSVSSKMRVLSEPFRRSQPRADDESFADFVRRKFGTEILEHLAGPFVSGVFAGDPEKLSLRSSFPSVAQWETEYGSVIRGAMKSRRGPERVRPTLASFRGGMATLLEAIAKKLGSSLTRGVTVNSVRHAELSGWTLDCTGSNQASSQQDTFSTRALIIATPAFTAAKLLETSSEQLAATLGGIPYAPIAVVALGYRREHVGHALNGFGFLVPRTEKLRTLGTIWNSSLFPERCPQNTVLLTSFLGGATDTQAVQMDNDQIVREVHREIAGVLQISAPPIIQYVWRSTRALPQYNLGHAQKISAVQDDIRGLSGVFLAGNYLDGPSIGNCVSRGFRTAKNVHDFLSR